MGGPEYGKTCLYNTCTLPYLYLEKVSKITGGFILQLKTKTLNPKIFYGGLVTPKYARHTHTHIKKTENGLYMRTYINQTFKLFLFFDILIFISPDN